MGFSWGVLRTSSSVQTGNALTGSYILLDLTRLDVKLTQYLSDLVDSVRIIWQAINKKGQCSIAYLFYTV